MEIGKHTYGANNIEVKWGDQQLYNTKKKDVIVSNLKIGNFCSIATNIIVYLGGNHRTNWITTYPFGHVNKSIFNRFNGYGHPSTNGDVIIGNDVWIGNNVTIMSGVKIGDGSIISANSHVVSDVKPYSIVGGNPAKFYYFRFDEETIKKLLSLKWWDMDDNIINEISPLLCSNNLDELFNRFQIKI